MSLVTRCPRCQRAFQVVLDQLRLHDGLVRCGGCSMVFDGYACLETNLPTLTRLASDLAPDSPAPEASSAPSATPDIRPASDQTSASVAAPAGVAHDIPRWTSPAVALARATPPASGASPAPIVLSAYGTPATPVNPGIPGAQLPPTASVAPAAPAPATTHSDSTPAAFAPYVSPMTVRPADGADAPGAGPAVMRRRVAEAPDDQDGEPSLSSLDPYEREDGEGDHQPAMAVLGESRLRGPGPSAVGRTEPEFLIEDEPVNVFTRALWAIASVAALVVLLGQLVYVYRNEFSTLSPSLRIVISSACVRIGCDVNFVRHLDKITIDASSLQQVGGAAQEGQSTELLLSMSMRNRLDKAQSWPSLQLELKDASGTVLVRKEIPPHQYLPSTLVDQPFAPGQEVNLTLPLTVAPGLMINGFQVRVFFP